MLSFSLKFNPGKEMLVCDVLSLLQIEEKSNKHDVSTLNFLSHELLDENIQGHYFQMVTYLYTPVQTSTR